MRNSSRKRRFRFVCLVWTGAWLAPATGFAADVGAEHAVDEALLACTQDLSQYCTSVTPGEGRTLACLAAHEDKLTEACAAALADVQRSSLIDLRSITSLPTLEDRELGDPVRNAAGEPVVWNRALPFLAQKVVELGFDLPEPYGVAVIPTWIRHDLVLENLSVSINDGPLISGDFVDIGSPRVENEALQLKLDAWLFPFLNVYATIGKFTGEATVPLTVEGRDLFPALCNVTPNRPTCLQTFSAVAQPSYHGENVSVGFSLAMGWERFFVALPVTYAWSDVNIIDTTATALNVAPRVGVTGDVGNMGVLSVFLGATYLFAEVDVAGRVVFDTPDVPGSGTTAVDFELTQKNKDKWNYALGFNWDITKKWGVMAEAGFGGSREQFLASATYRF